MTDLNALRLSVSSSLAPTARKWRRKCNEVLAAHNVSEACAAPLLSANRQGEAVRQVALAELVGIEGPSLVRLLDQLCAAGLVRRDEDPDDRRAKTISLTDAGRSLTICLEDELRALRERVLKDVSRADLEATLRVLSAFNAALSETPRPAAGQ
jgi:MarR family transcriptional regulator for hemolysin